MEREGWEDGGVKWGVAQRTAGEGQPSLNYEGSGDLTQVMRLSMSTGYNVCF